MGAQVLFHINDVFIGLGYIWVSIELVRFAVSSEVVKKLRLNSSITDLYQKIGLNTVCFAISFFLCGTSHLFRALPEPFLGLHSQIVVVMLSLQTICAFFAIITSVILTLCIPSILEATNALEITPEGRLRDAETALLDVIDNCKESVSILTLPNLTFIRGNTSTSLCFGAGFLDEKVTNFIIEEDQSIFRNCISKLLQQSEIDYGSNMKTNSINSEPTSLGIPLASVKRCHEVSDEESPLMSSSSTTSSSPNSSMIIEYRVKLPTMSELKWLESTVLLHREGATGATVVLLLTRDINVKKTEEELVKRANNAKLQYITCCAHDLKTPLQSFSSALDLLQESGLTLDQLDIWKQAEVSLALMNLTIAQTMDSSKAVMGFDLLPKKTECVLSEVLTKVAIIIESYGRQVPIYFTMARGVCNYIITDVEWLWQMLLNMLTNACKHTEDGCIHVNITLCHEYPQGRKIVHTVEKHSPCSSHDHGEFMEKANRRNNQTTSKLKAPQLCFQIVDSGVGIDASQHDSLFEPFSQAQAGQSTGTGLGLFSVFNRSRKLGGACGVTNPPNNVGDGSMFWFTIPYLPTSEAHFMTRSDFNRYTPSHLPCPRCLTDGTVVMGIDVTWSKKADPPPLTVTDEKPHHEQAQLPVKQEGVSSSILPTIPPPSSIVVGEDKLIKTAGVDTIEQKQKICLPYTAYIVDDVQSIRVLLQKTLLRLGFTRVEVFENGKRALDAMKKEIVDVVFMDIQMPIMSGPEAIRRLREFEKTENRRRQFVVAVSANNDNNIVGPAGFDLQRDKPLRQQEIVTCMNMCIASKATPTS